MQRSWSGGNPAVYGSCPSGVRRTVLIYCHYDVKPAPPAGWLQPSPFEPVLRRGTAEGGAPIVGLADVADDLLPQHRLYARGASDDKGPIWAHLTALELMRAQGIAPRVALKFIFDGEEEMGSTHFGSFTERHRDLLAADVALVMDGPKDASGRPTVAFGARGILSLGDTEAARRGRTRQFSVTNPLADDGCWIDGGDDGTHSWRLEEGVVTPRPRAPEQLDASPSTRAAIGGDGRGRPRVFERIMLRSTLTIRGLKSGFTGRKRRRSSRTRPRWPDARLVKNQRVDVVYRRILDHIRGQGFAVIESADAPIPDELRGRAVRVVERRGYDPAKTAADLPISRQVIETVERAHGGAPAVVLPTMGGSVPLWAFTDILKLPTIVVPYANANNRQHSPTRPAPGSPLPGRADYCAPLHDLG